MSDKKDHALNTSIDRYTKKIKIGFLVSNVLDYIIMLLLVVIIAFGAFSLWDSNQILEAASSNNYQTYKPTTKDTLSFDELRKMNSEVFSWLNVYGTKIDYPIVQGENNSKYINMDAKGDFSLAGSIYLDSANTPNFKDFNSIIYGHHMANENMFGSIDKFVEKNYFDKHKYGNIFYEGKNYGLEFFSFIEADAYDWTLYRPNITDENAKAEYLSYILSISKHVRDINISADERIVLLSTCASSTNGRYVLVGRISDNTFENTFDDQPDNNIFSNITKQSLSLLTNIPFYLVISVVIVITGIVKRIMKYKREKRLKNEGQGRRNDENNKE